jgi:uncharacterized protein
MNGETNLPQLLSTMMPALNEGDYVFCCNDSTAIIDPQKIIGLFKEKEGVTIILEKKWADELNLSYSFVAAWITLTVHSSLEAVGLTATFSAALAKESISCNVVAGFYHDHIFVNKNDVEKAIAVLNNLTRL